MPAEQALATYTKVVTHAPKREGPILCGVRHPRAPDVYDAGDTLAVREEIRKTGRRYHVRKLGRFANDPGSKRSCRRARDLGPPLGRVHPVRL